MPSAGEHEIKNWWKWRHRWGQMLATKLAHRSEKRTMTLRLLGQQMAERLSPHSVSTAACFPQIKRFTSNRPFSKVRLTLWQSQKLQYCHSNGGDRRSCWAKSSTLDFVKGFWRHSLFLVWRSCVVPPLECRVWLSAGWVCWLSERAYSVRLKRDNRIYGIKSYVERVVCF